MRRFLCCLAITMLLPACAHTGEQAESQTDNGIQTAPDIEVAETAEAALGEKKHDTGKAPNPGSISKYRTDEEIQNVFDQNKKALYYIYQRALSGDPTLKGKLILKITIASSGQVLASTVESSELQDYNLERKIAARVKLFDFGPSEQQLTFTYPIDFIPR